VSYASENANELRTACLARYDELRRTVDQASKAVIKLRADADVMDVLREANRYALALAELSDMAEIMRANADKAIAACMSRIGCSSFHDEHQTIYTRHNPAGVDIHDERAVPEECMTSPEPKPDKAKVRAYLKEHPGANFASLRPATIGLSRRSL
jgi:hypothetical protein